MVTLSISLCLSACIILDNSELIRGEARPEINSNSETVNPPGYRLKAEPFRYEMQLTVNSPELDISIYEVKFPSAVRSPYEVNNMVYAMYYRPNRCDRERVPGVIVLDILDGSQRVARAQALYLACRGVAVLTLYLPYYGPRRPGNVRFLSPNLEHTRRAMEQAVLDVRRAVAWLRSRPEIDQERLTVMGTSFGSFIAGLSAAMEPGIRRVIILLGGGGLVDAYYDHPRVQPYRKVWEALGGTRQRLKELVAPLDPVTYADRLRDREVLIIAGKRDEIVPPQAAEALAKACPGAKLIWFNCTHYSAILYFIPAMELSLQVIQATPR
ncbi:MAG: prolyl oligopeptidase family serine peptidase [Gemmatales bacterium]|nr:prolyl oligopeptidase family serine peptidase [Gemmatales bacterium]MDW8221657.1 prolyl oligopeptidase family serine peptidase [Gemmatales bacterium]